MSQLGNTVGQRKRSRVGQWDTLSRWDSVRGAGQPGQPGQMGQVGQLGQAGQEPQSVSLPTLHSAKPTGAISLRNVTGEQIAFASAAVLRDWHGLKGTGVKSGAVTNAPLRQGGPDMERNRLANRRSHEVIAFTFRGRSYVAGIGRFDDGSIAELFIDAEKQSTNAADDARDAAVTASLALQSGCPLDAIRAAVTRDTSGCPAGIIGAVLDLIEGQS